MERTSEDMARVTLVCCYNDKNLLDQLKKSIKMQSETAHLVLIDNTQHAYTSCAQAYNEALKRIDTEAVIFLHQDVLLSGENTLQVFTDYILQGTGDSIYGVAGADIKDQNKYQYYSFLRQAGSPVEAAGVRRPIKCQTLDECFFGGRTSMFQRFPFDETTCDNWHFYAVDRCLEIGRYGGSAFVCDVPIVHNSMGKLTSAFFRSYRRLCRKYHRWYPYIATTCAFSKTDIVSRNVLCMKIRFRNSLRHG